MRSRLLALGFVAVAILTLAGPARAVTANGPYYALPSWDQSLPANTRFIVLSNMGGAAVLDRETGLVWEQAPNLTELLWIDALGRCATATTGNRRGWRLPSVQELGSLVDLTTTFPVLALPPGHPFTIATTGSKFFWTATSSAFNSGFAYYVEFDLGGSFVFNKTTAELFTWCVRGGSGAAAQ